MDKNTINIKGVSWAKLPSKDKLFIINHEVLHRVYYNTRAAQMGEELQLLPTNHVLLMEPGERQIELSRALDNYLARMADQEAVFELMERADWSMEAMVDTLARYQLMRG